MGTEETYMVPKAFLMVLGSSAALERITESAYHSPCKSIVQTYPKHLKDKEARNALSKKANRKENYWKIAGRRA